jgi:hypothetical protein
MLVIQEKGGRMMAGDGVSDRSQNTLKRSYGRPSIEKLIVLY